MRALIVFFLPLNRAMAIDANEGFFGTVGNTIHWLQDMYWPEDLTPLKEQVGNKDFVAFRFYQSIEPPKLDTRPLDLAMNGLSHFTGLGLPKSEEPVDNPFELFFPDFSIVSGTTARMLTTVEWKRHGAEKAVSDAFDKATRELRMLEEAYLHVSRDPHYQVFSRNSAYLSCLYSIFPYDTQGQGNWSDPGVFLVNEGFKLGSEVPMLPSDQIPRLVTTWTRNRQRDPFVRFVSMSIEAQVALQRDGDYGQCVVKAYSAIEFLLDAIWTTMAWEEITYGENPQKMTTYDDAKSWFGPGSTLANRMTNCFHGRLSGWDVDHAQTPAKEFRHVLAKLRHRVVHAGYAPTEREANKALITLEGMEHYLKALLVRDDNRNRHPRTVLLLLGEPGLKRRGKFVGKVRRLVERDDEENWTDSVVEFRDRLSVDVWGTS